MALKTRANKIFISVKDEILEDRKQLSVISSLVSGNEVYLNQYGKVFTQDEIGNFDIKIINNSGIIEFFPIDGNINNYSYNYITYSIEKYIKESGVYDFGDCLYIESKNNTIQPVGIHTIFTINENTSSLKFIIEVSSESSNNYEYIELNVIIKDSDAYISEYGRITLSNDEQIQRVGLGTYGISFNNQNPDLIFYPNTQDVLDCNLIGISIFKNGFNVTKKNQIRFSDIKSVNESISASNNPTPQVISSYTSDYNFGYFIVQVTDKTNNEIELSEILLLNQESQCSMVEYGNVRTSNSLGTFDCFSSTTTELLFTPNQNIDVDITLLHHSAANVPLLSVPSSIDLKNSEITSGFSKYESENLKKSFELTHKSIPIFKRRFDGSFLASDTQFGVDLDSDLIYLPNHFFRSGEKIIYSSSIFDYVDILSTTTSQLATINSNIIYVDSTLGLTIDDFLNLNNNIKNKIIEVTSTYVKLLNPINYEIPSGSNVSFSRLFETIDTSNPSIAAIGIAQTYISGVGVTDKLSGDLYAYTPNINFVGFCTSPIYALTEPPKLIDLNAPGIGDRHYISAINQNSKCLIAIDNIIQAPVSLTPITTTLQNDLSTQDEIVYCSGISSFFSGDLIKIDEEIMKINYSSIGIGNSILVERSALGTGISTHSSGTEIVKLVGNYNIVGDNIYFASAPYGPIYDEINGDVNVRSTFQGRVFIRSGIPDSNIETYEKNYIFDDISSKFDAKTKTFKLTENGNNVSDISGSNSIILVNNIFQSPEVDYNLTEDLSETTLGFTGTATSALYDVNTSSVPRGGIILSVGSSNGYGYQPLVSAGGTAVVSISGTIQSISIGNSGSGYRPLVQPIVNVGVQTISNGIPNIEYVGIASIIGGNVVGVSITNPGSGYDLENPPNVIFDSPLSYSDLELKYHESNTGIGSQSKIDIVVGNGSSVINFNIKNYGYSYKVGDILTIESGGLSGIPTDTSKQFQPFTLTVEKVFSDTFSGWFVGELQKLDDIDHLFDGIRRKFPIADNDTKFAIVTGYGSPIDTKSLLLIFINDVLQEPNVAYKFSGKSAIEFTEAPKPGSKCRILFYRGTPDVDVIDTDIIETVKIGDKLQIIGDKFNLIENKRIVSKIKLADTVETNLYNSVGISSDDTLLRPVKWCKQKEDITIDGINISKSRINYEPNIFPVCNIIQPISIGQSQIYVDNVKSIFDAKNENVEYKKIDAIEILENTEKTVAIATAVVSIAGTIQSVNIVDPGFGYNSIPKVVIQSPTNSTLGIAALSAELSSGSVSNILIDNAGSGYDINKPPLVLIEPPKTSTYYINDVVYSGDYGIISGVNTISVGYASTGLVFDLYIPQDSYLRKVLVTDPEIINSQIKEGYYFKVSNSNIGSGVDSLRADGSIIGVGTTGIDNIYQVISVSLASTDVYGVGLDSVAKVVVSVSSYDGIIGFGYSSYYGDYSWGIIDIKRSTRNYNVHSDYGVVGLNSTPIIRRYNKLKHENYTDT